MRGPISVARPRARPSKILWTERASMRTYGVIFGQHDFFFAARTGAIRLSLEVLTSDEP